MGLTVSEVVEPTRMRQTIAARLGESYREAVHVPLHRTVDVTELLDDASGDATRLGLMDALILASATALVEHPSFNAVLQDGKQVIVEEVNIGLATDTPHGLLVPVLRNVDQLSVADVRHHRRRLVELVVEKRHKLDDLIDGTFTISNLGVLGIDVFDPIINPPQLAILGVGRVRDEFVPDGTTPRHAKRMTLSLCFDHRFYDGAPAARFLDSVASRLEDPRRLIALATSDAVEPTG